MRGPSTLLIALLTGCSAVVGGPTTAPEDVPCEVIDFDPCNAGQMCVDGRCTSVGDRCDGVDNDLDGETDEGSDTAAACAMPTEICVGGECVPGMAETCNDMDDDRDGETDEGLDVDLDGDLFTTCGRDPATRDCVDRPGVGESINPGAAEVCDGYDNDCNPATPDPSCGADQVCATPIGGDRPECLDRMSCRLTGCGTGERCDGAMDRCIVISDCRVAGMECPIGQVCNVPVEGGAPSCTPAPPGAIGTVCTDGTQCSSGVCMPFSALRLDPTPGALGICGAACCNHADCAALGPDLSCLAPGTGARSCVPRAMAGEAADVPLCVAGSACPSERCRLATASTGSSTLFNVFACGPQVGDQDGLCAFDSDCRSGVCSGGLCRNACGSRAGCVFGCIYVSAPPSDWVTVCGLHGDAEAGDTCAENGDCLEGYCDPTAHVCRGTCCADRQCGGGSCVPVDNAGWEMRCSVGPLPG